MKFSSFWAEETWRIVVLILVAGVIGALIDQILICLLVALLAYIFRNLFNLHRLANWLSEPQVSAIPIRFGLWGDIYSRIARVSERQAQREKRLTKMLNEYAASMSALPDATVALDAQKRIRWFNEAASRLLALQAAKDIGQPLMNLFRDPEMVAFIDKQDYSKIIQAAAPGNSERKLEMRLAPYGEGQTLLLAQDITARLRHERVRKDFVANVSHELRTPLTVLSGFIENLQNDENLPDQRWTRPLDLMSQQATRMRQIVEDLLLLARLESDSTPGRQDGVDIGRILRLVADDCRELRTEVPTIDCDIQSQRCVLGDETQLRSAVTNLAVNAVNHTPADGKVTLAWSDDGVESTLEVRDTGEGIAPEYIPRLTERFYRVDAGRSRERGGTGLGLAIVKHVLNRHDVRLEILSRLGQGSRFICRFPASRLLDC
ncbi:MAG: phosphate regulon sensor histidine kinase PhoR [Sedimenticolaceae bacterium]